MSRRASNSLVRRACATASLASLLLIALSPALASEPRQVAALQFVAPQIERQHKAKFEAQYRAFHNAIMDVAGLSSELTFLPIYEAQAQVARREKDGQVGGVCGVKRGSPIVYSLPYASLTRHLITVNDSPALAGLEDLRGMRLGLVRRYYYQLPDEQTLKSMGVQVHKVDAQINAVAMLASGRIDAVLASPEVIESILNALDIEAKLRYTEQPFSLQMLCYVLPHTKQGKALSSRINAAILELHQQDRLQEFVRPPFYPPTGTALGLAKPN